jgi:hypothetical protein
MNVILDQPAKPSVVDINLVSRKVMDECGKSVCSKEDLEKLREAQRSFLRARSESWFFSSNQASKDWAEHCKGLVSACRDGSLRDIATSSLEEWQKNYRQKSAAADTHARNVTLNVFPLAADVAKRFAKIADDFAETAEGTEKQQCERFGAPHTPSALTMALKRVSTTALARVRKENAVFASPAELVPFLDV